MKQAANREDPMRALSDSHAPNDDAVQGYRDQYGNGAFDQYMREESRQDEDSQYGQEEDGEQEAMLAIEHGPA